MSEQNPFSGPFAGAPGIGGNPLDGEENVGVCCPKCKSQKFRAWTGEYGVMRTCLEKGCGEERSGSTVKAGRSNFLNLYPQPLPNTQAPDDDLPLIQYTGSPFRDPGRNFGGDDDY